MPAALLAAVRSTKTSLNPIPGLETKEKMIMTQAEKNVKAFVEYVSAIANIDSVETRNLPNGVEALVFCTFGMYGVEMAVKAIACANCPSVICKGRKFALDASFPEVLIGDRAFNFSLFID